MVTPTRKPLVDVVIPLYRPGPWLAPCVDSVLASRDAHPVIWLVDDNPESDLADLVTRRWKSVNYLPAIKNVGFAASCNRGIQAGRTQYVLMLNQDARIEPDYVTRLVGLLDSDPGLAAAGGVLYHQENPATPPGGTIDTAGFEFRRGRRPVDIGQGDRDTGQYEGVREVFGVNAAAALYRREALEAVADSHGVFDERFFMHKEDIDLAWRLRRAGFRAAIDGAARGYHARGVHRAPDVAGRTPAALVRRFAGLLSQERAKSPSLRRLAWRNQVLMLIKNERADDLQRSALAISTHLVAQTLVSFVLSPISTLFGRLAVLRALPGALNERRHQTGAARLHDWLP